MWRTNKNFQVFTEQIQLSPMLSWTPLRHSLKYLPKKGVEQIFIFGLSIPVVLESFIPGNPAEKTAYVG